MTGDQNDVSARLRGLLPPWFGAALTPVLSALLGGIAAALSFVYSLYAYAVLQTRLQTTTEGWLDLAAWDFFGPDLLRRTLQSDASFRTTIQANLIRPRGTRPAIIKVITDLTGIAPTVIEPMRPLDCGAYGVGISAYGTAGYWGSRSIPYQAFVQFQLPAYGGIPSVIGYGNAPGGYGQASQIEYASLSYVNAQVT